MEWHFLFQLICLRTDGPTLILKAFPCIIHPNSFHFIYFEIGLIITIENKLWINLWIPGTCFNFLYRLQSSGNGNLSISLPSLCSQSTFATRILRRISDWITQYFSVYSYNYSCCPSDPEFHPYIIFTKIIVTFEKIRDHLYFICI